MNATFKSLLMAQKKEAAVKAAKKQIKWAVMEAYEEYAKAAAHTDWIRSKAFEAECDSGRSNTLWARYEAAKKVEQEVAIKTGGNFPWFHGCRNFWAIKSGVKDPDIFNEAFDGLELQQWAYGCILVDRI